MKRIAIEIYSIEKLFEIWEEMVDLGYTLSSWTNIFKRTEIDWLGFLSIERGGIYLCFDLDKCIMIGWGSLYYDSGKKFIIKDFELIIDSSKDDIRFHLNSIKMGLL